MTQAQVQNVIKEMVSRIVTKFDPDKVILFGSYARGTAGPDSDVDLLVVFRHLEDTRRKKAIDIRVALNGMGSPKDVVVRTPEDLEQEKKVAGTIGREVQKDGKVLYERPH